MINIKTAPVEELKFLLDNYNSCVKYTELRICAERTELEMSERRLTYFQNWVNELTRELKQRM